MKYKITLNIIFHVEAKSKEAIEKIIKQTLFYPNRSKKEDIPKCDISYTIKQEA